MATNVLRPSLFGADPAMKNAMGAAYSAVTPPESASPAPPVQQAPSAPAPASVGYNAAATPVAPASAPPAPLNATTSGMVDQFKNAVKPKPDQDWVNIWDGITDPKDKQDLQDYITFIGTLPDYKGSREAGMAAIAQYARQLKMNRRDSSGIDDHAIAGIGDNYNALDDQLGAQLAAMGVSGPALAGAHSNLRSKENATIGEYWAQANEQRRKEMLAMRMQQLGFDQQMIQMAMQRYQQEHQGGGFLGDLLGTVGTIGGALIGGPAGGIIGHGIGSFVGGQSNSGGSAGYGNNSAGGYGPPDETQYYGPWQQP